MTPKNRWSIKSKPVNAWAYWTMWGSLCDCGCDCFNSAFAWRLSYLNDLTLSVSAPSVHSHYYSVSRISICFVKNNLFSHLHLERIYTCVEEKPHNSVSIFWLFPLKCIDFRSGWLFYFYKLNKKLRVIWRMHSTVRASYLSSVINSM